MKPMTPRAPVGSTTPAVQSANFSLTRSSRGDTAGHTQRSTAGRNSSKASHSGQELLFSSTPSGSARGSQDVDDKVWRSGLVQLESAMRELVSSGGNLGVPTVERIEETLRYYDELLTLVSPTIASILKLFRIEFCRAIFSASPMVTGDVGQVPFFEKISVMLKECMVLKAEIDAAESDTSVLEMKKQIQKLSSLVPYYEQEVNRLARENKRLFDDLSRVEAELESASKIHQQAVMSVDDEIRKLTVENRELQLQVFKLGKGTREVSAGQSSYMHLKQQKMELLQQMFEEGNEAATLMLLMHQLDYSINMILDEFDMAFLRAGQREVGSLRIKLSKQISILLEEFHFLEVRYNAVTDGKLRDTTLKASAMYDMQMKAVRREAKRKNTKAATREGGGRCLSPLLLQGTAAANRDESYEQMVLADEIVKQKKLEWSKNIFGAVVENRELPHKARQEHHTWDPLAVFKEAFASPMLDTSTTKFMCGVDVVAQAGGNQTLVRSVNYIDPTSLMELPPRTTHVRLKYTSTFIKPVTQNLTEEQLQRQSSVGDSDELRSTSVLDWSPAHRTFAGKPQSAVIAGSTHMDGPIWHAYKACFGTSQPNLPRPIELFHIDYIFLQSCVKHDQRMQRRYQAAADTAGLRSTSTQMGKALAERLFRDEFQFYDFQYSMMEVLESRYGFPELVGRVMFEILFTLEKEVTEQPHLKIYMDALAGTSGIAQAHCISSMMHLVTSYWPLPMSQVNTAIAERDIVSVIRMLYPSDGTIKVNVDDVMAELSIASNQHFSLFSLRNFIMMSVSQLREPIVRKFHDILTYRASVVQWAELDHQDLLDSTKALLPEDAPNKSILTQHYTTCTILGKSSRIPPAELAYIAASAIWVTHSKSKT